MLSIADSRFQPELLRVAKESGKIAKDYEIPDAFRNNTPERIETALKPFDLPPFPFGTDFTPVEQRLLPALERLQHAGPGQIASLALKGFFHTPSAENAEALSRMGLEKPGNVKERFYRALVSGALR
jgi:hypothetical protein